MILVVAEQRDGQVNRASWEAIVAGQRLAASVGAAPVKVAVLGSGIGAAAAELSAASVAEVLAVEHAALEHYTADGYVGALAPLVRSLAPTYVVFAHTYQARDFVPKLVQVGQARDGESSPIRLKAVDDLELIADIIASASKRIVAKRQAAVS